MDHQHTRHVNSYQGLCVHVGHDMKQAFYKIINLSQSHILCCVCRLMRMSSGIQRSFGNIKVSSHDRYALCISDVESGCWPCNLTPQSFSLSCFLSLSVNAAQWTRERDQDYRLEVSHWRTGHWYSQTWSCRRMTPQRDIKRWQTWMMRYEVSPCCCLDPSVSEVVHS